jgi:hypothetical protein
MTALIRWTVPAVHHEDGVLILDFMYCLILTFLSFLRITDWAADSRTFSGTVLAQGANGSPLCDIFFSSISLYQSHLNFCIFPAMSFKIPCCTYRNKGRSLFGIINSLYLLSQLDTCDHPKDSNLKRPVSCKTEADPHCHWPSFKSIPSPFVLPYHIFPEIRHLFLPLFGP